MHEIIMVFIRGFSPAHKNCKKLLGDTILYKWYKYNIFAKLSHLINPKSIDKKCITLVFGMYTIHDATGIYFKVVKLT